MTLSTPFGALKQVDAGPAERRIRQRLALLKGRRSFFYTAGLMTFTRLPRSPPAGRGRVPRDLLEDLSQRFCQAAAKSPERISHKYGVLPIGTALTHAATGRRRRGHALFGDAGACRRKLNTGQRGKVSGCVSLAGRTPARRLPRGHKWRAPWSAR
jgi:hypothetical protein